MSNPPTRRLGSVLVDAKVLSEHALEAALERQQETGQRLGAVLVDMGLLDEQTIVAALGIQFDMPVADCHQRPEHRAVALLPEPVARTVRAAPLRQTPLGLEVAVADALDGSTLAQLEQAVGGHVLPRLARDEDVRQMIDLAYQERSPARSPQASTGPLNESLESLPTVVAGAVRAGASDVHLVPDQAGARALYRIDGVLHPAGALSAPAWAAAAREAKRLAGAGRRGRRPHAGSFLVDGRAVRALASWSPTVQGERLRLRLVPQDADAGRSLGQLGMPADMAQSFTALLHRPSGLIVVAGPRRSGRTSTAYAAAAAMDTEARSVVLAQPVATRVVPSVCQVEIDVEPGGPALLALAEDQDADCVVIDELEGSSVARAALRLAQRGLLVVLTVTAVDTAPAVTPFLTAGIAPSLVEGSLAGVLRQRLEAAPGGRRAVFDLSLEP